MAYCFSVPECFRSYSITRGLGWLFIGLIIFAPFGSQSARANILLLQNFEWYYDTTLNQWWHTNDVPVFLADGATRASGSNYVVELLAPNGSGASELIGSARMLDGALAGLFGDGRPGRSIGVTSPLLPWCGLGLVTIRIWDSSTGTNFNSATLKGAVSFDNYINVYCCDPPCLPTQLIGFSSFALGNPQWETNKIGFYAPTNPFFPRPKPYFSAPKSDPKFVINVRRTGDMGRPDTVAWFLFATNAPAGPPITNGWVTFPPDDVVETFKLAMAPDLIRDHVATFKLALSNAAPNQVFAQATADVLVFDENYLKLEWGGRHSDTIAINVHGFSDTGLETYQLQQKARLSASSWVDVPITPYGSARVNSDLSFTWSYYFPTNFIPGFFRAMKK